MKKYYISVTGHLYFGCVVEAEDEKQARDIAEQIMEDEPIDSFDMCDFDYEYEEVDENDGWYNGYDIYKPDYVK